MLHHAPTRERPAKLTHPGCDQTSSLSGMCAVAGMALRPTGAGGGSGDAASFGCIVACDAPHPHPHATPADATGSRSGRPAQRESRLR